MVVEGGTDAQGSDAEGSEGLWTRQSMGLVINVPSNFTVGDIAEDKLLSVFQRNQIFYGGDVG